MCISILITVLNKVMIDSIIFAVDLFRNRSQKTSKCGKNISDTLACGSCATALFLPHLTSSVNYYRTDAQQHGIYKMMMMMMMIIVIIDNPSHFLWNRSRVQRLNSTPLE